MNGLVRVNWLVILISVLKNMGMENEGIFGSSFMERVVREQSDLIRGQIDAVFKEGLLRKGYSFERDVDLCEFIKNNCVGGAYGNQTTYMVKGVPFLVIIDKEPVIEYSIGVVGLGFFIDYRFL